MRISIPLRGRQRRIDRCSVYLNFERLSRPASGSSNPYPVERFAYLSLAQCASVDKTQDRVKTRESILDFPWLLHFSEFAGTGSRLRNPVQPTPFSILKHAPRRPARCTRTHARAHYTDRDRDRRRRTCAYRFLVAPDAVQFTFVRFRSKCR